MAKVAGCRVGLMAQVPRGGTCKQDREMAKVCGAARDDGGLAIGGKSVPKGAAVFRRHPPNQSRVVRETAGWFRVWEPSDR